MWYSSFEYLEQNWRIRKEKIESFIEVIWGPNEVFVDFLQRLASIVNRMISNSEARQIITKTVAFENSNSQCKKIIRTL